METDSIVNFSPSKPISCVQLFIILELSLFNHSPVTTQLSNNILIVLFNKLEYKWDKRISESTLTMIILSHGDFVTSF